MFERYRALFALRNRSSSKRVAQLLVSWHLRGPSPTVWCPAARHDPTTTCVPPRTVCVWLAGRRAEAEQQRVAEARGARSRGAHGRLLPDAPAARETHIFFSRASPTRFPMRERRRATCWGSFRSSVLCRSLKRSLPTRRSTPWCDFLLLRPWHSCTSRRGDEVASTRACTNASCSAALARVCAAAGAARSSGGPRVHRREAQPASAGEVRAGRGRGCGRGCAGAANERLGLLAHLGWSLLPLNSVLSSRHRMRGGAGPHGL